MAGFYCAAWPGRQNGGTVDVLTRIAAQQLASKIDVPVIVENRAGATGAIALQAAARHSEPALVTVPGPIIYTLQGEVQSKPNRLLQEVFQAPEFKQAVIAAGMNTGSGTPEDLIRFIESDTKKWDDLVQKRGISLQE